MIKEFPFQEIRKGQEDLINDVYESVKNGKNLIANAPTGLGKTIGVLYPAVKYAIENKKTVFFLTPRHSQHVLAIDTLKKMKEKMDFVACDIIGKKWLCPVEGIDKLSSGDFTEYCKQMRSEERCPYYKNTIKKHDLTEKAQDAMVKIFREQPIHSENIKDLCPRLCSYEISAKLAEKSNVIVCDYYHIFAPIGEVLLKRLNKKLEDCVIIVDEAHNLPDRIRNLMSVKISSFNLKAAMKEAGENEMNEIYDHLRILNDVMRDLTRNMEIGDQKKIDKNDFVDRISKEVDYYSLLEMLQISGNEIREKQKRSYIGSIAKFLDSWLGDDEGYLRIIEKSTYNSRDVLTLSYKCMDPSLITGDIINDSHSTVLMSATMKPMEMYKDLLGIDDVELKEYKSNFPEENRLGIVIPDVTTKYTERNDEEYRRIADYIIRCTDNIPGNTAVFFPSYYFRNIIYNKAIQRGIKKEILLEDQQSNKEEKNRLIKKFSSMSEQGAVLFGVMGGSFSEGIDLPGKLLKAVIVVGIPLAKPDLETKSLIEYYNKKFKRGMDYAYIYPALMKVVQAAGRCIRSEKDKGIIVLMDKRYLWSNYRKAVPFDLLRTKYPEIQVKKFFEK